MCHEKKETTITGPTIIRMLWSNRLCVYVELRFLGKLLTQLTNYEVVYARKKSTNFYVSEYEEKNNNILTIVVFFR